MEGEEVVVAPAYESHASISPRTTLLTLSSGPPADGQRLLSYFSAEQTQSPDNFHIQQGSLENLNISEAKKRCI